MRDLHDGYTRSRRRDGLGVGHKILGPLKTIPRGQLVVYKLSDCS